MLSKAKLNTAKKKIQTGITRPPETDNDQATTADPGLQKQPTGTTRPTYQDNDQATITDSNAENLTGSTDQPNQDNDQSPAANPGEAPVTSMEVAGDDGPWHDGRKRRAQKRGNRGTQEIDPKRTKDPGEPQPTTTPAAPNPQQKGPRPFILRPKPNSGTWDPGSVAGAIDGSTMGRVRIRTVRARDGFFEVVPLTHPDSVQLLNAYTAGEVLKRLFDLQPPKLEPARRPKAYELIVRNIDPSLTEDEVKQELTANGLTSIRRVRRFTKTHEDGSRSAIPVVAVELTSHLEYIGALDGKPLRVFYRVAQAEEPHHRNIDPVRCYRCQVYGHRQADCRADPKCLICGKLDCPVATSQDRTLRCPNSPGCVNCGGSHPSMSRKCPKRQEEVTKQLESSSPAEDAPPSQAGPAPRRTTATRTYRDALAQAAPSLPDTALIQKMVTFTCDLFMKVLDSLTTDEDGRIQTDSIVDLTCNLAACHLDTHINASRLTRSVRATEDQPTVELAYSSIGRAERILTEAAKAYLEAHLAQTAQPSPVQ